MKRFLMKLSCAVGVNVMAWLLITLVAAMLDAEQAKVDRFMAITATTALSLLYADFMADTIYGKEETK